ncbi:hypothetical protein [Azospirillum palustre]
MEYLDSGDAGGSKLCGPTGTALVGVAETMSFYELSVK